jgi:hypothetical protein
LVIAVLFFHVYTCTVLAAVTVIFLIAMLLVRKNNNSKKNSNNNNNHLRRRRIIWLLVFGLLPSIVVDLTRISLTGSTGGLEQDIEIAQRALGLEQFNLRWQILNVTMYDTFAAVLSHFVILVLGLVWVIKSNLREHSTVYLMIFLSAGLVALFFGNWQVQARVFYDMPFEIPAAIALYYISTRLGSMLVPAAACTWIIAMSLFTVMNYYLILVPGAR